LQFQSIKNAPKFQVYTLGLFLSRKTGKTFKYGLASHEVQPWWVLRVYGWMDGWMKKYLIFL